MITDHISTARRNNPKGLDLFVKRAQILLGELAEGSSCPFFLAGRVGREFVGGDRDAAVLLFRSLSDVGTPQEGVAVNVTNADEARAWVRVWGGKPRRGIAREVLRGLEMAATLALPRAAEKYRAAAQVIRPFTR